MKRTLAFPVALALLTSSACGAVSNAAHVAHGISNIANGKLPKQLQDFDAKAKAAQTAVFTAEYKETTTSGGTSSTDKNQNIVIVQKPPKSKYQQGDSLLIDDGKNEISCGPTGDNNKEQCLIIGPSTGTNGLGTGVAGFTQAFSLPAIITAFEVAAIVPGISFHNTTRDVAGQHLDCVTLDVHQNGKNNHSEYCETKDGILGYVDNGDGDVFSLASYSTGVSDSDFTPPATPKTQQELINEATSTTEEPSTTSTTAASTDTSTTDTSTTDTTPTTVSGDTTTTG